MYLISLCVCGCVCFHVCVREIVSVCVRVCNCASKNTNLSDLVFGRRKMCVCVCACVCVCVSERVSCQKILHFLHMALNE